METRITAEQARELRKEYKFPENCTPYEQICVHIRECAKIGYRFIELPKEKLSLDTCKLLSDDGFFIYSETENTAIVSWMEFEEFYNSFIKWS